jgi:hypothetical protein
MTALAPPDISMLDMLIQRKQRKVLELRKVEIELHALRQAREEIYGRCAKGEMAPLPTGPSEAVIEILRNAPATHTSQQVAEMLRNKVFSRSDDPRRVILSTVSNLVRDGVVVRDELGRLAIAKKGTH